jgi:hypothetical protein
MTDPVLNEPAVTVTSDPPETDDEPDFGKTDVPGQDEPLEEEDHASV